MRTFLGMCLALSLFIVPAHAQQRRQQQHVVPQQHFVPQQRITPQQRYVVPQQRFVPQQRYVAPQHRAVPQQRYMVPQQRMYAVRQQHFQNVHARAYNHLTGVWGQRMGRKTVVAGLGIAAATYGYVWYSSPDYDGPAYVELPGVGFVEFDDDDRYPGIVADLISGDPSRIQSAIALVEGSAIMQGLMQQEETDGD